MARIPETTFKDWKDGDIVNAEEYERELEIIRAAVNDNYDRISTLQSAAGGSISRIPSGTTFPTSNIQPGQIFFRSDQEILYILGADSQWEPFTPKSFTDTHISNKANPHEVTASQVGAYTKAETDSLLASNPYFFADTGIRVAVNPNTPDQINFGGGLTKLNKGFKNENGGVTIRPDTAGVYKVDVHIEWSGINEDKIGQFWIRHYSDNILDYTFTNRGGYPMGNPGGFPVTGSVLLNMTSAHSIAIFAMHNDSGVRQTTVCRVSITKVGN